MICRHVTFTRLITTIGLGIAMVHGHAATQDAQAPQPQGFDPVEGERLPTGMRITPEAAPGARFTPLNPELPGFPDFLADHAVRTAISPDGKTLLVLTSGYNRLNDENGEMIEEASNEYVFVYDITEGYPKKVQSLAVPNTFNGIAWNPRPDRRNEFYVSGGVDDNVHVFTQEGGTWVESGVPILLGHATGEGLEVQPMAAGLTVSRDGDRLLVTNYENDSVTLIDLEYRIVLQELDLRPSRLNPRDTGVPGGEYPLAVQFKGNDKAYVASQRDREIVVLEVRKRYPYLKVTKRIETAGQPDNLLLDKREKRLFVASGNTDTAMIIDTDADHIVEEIPTVAPPEILPKPAKFKGANPNALALSPDEETLFVTNGGTNSVAVIQLARKRENEANQEHKAKRESKVIGLIPTGWYPNDVSLSPDGSMLFVVNGKDNAGPNPGGCRDNLSEDPAASNACSGRNLYVWQLEKAGLLALPMPDAAELADLTWQVAYNSNFTSAKGHLENKALMKALRERIKHVIYVVKENRTYDQVLGSLDIGNGDPNLAILAPYSPNHRKLAHRFVTLDNFYDSGETSNTGWNWTTAARTTDFTEKTSPVNYAGRGLTYDWEGTNRNINVGFATVEERQAANPYTPDDPDLLPGTADVAAPDGPKGEAGTGYLWDAALRRGLSVRNYGFYGDLSLYFVPDSDPNFIPPVRHPFMENVVQFYPTKESLRNITDPYFRGYDMNYPDYWRYKEWEREFDEYVKNGNLPNLSLVRLPHDHFGSFSTAMDGVNTVETQMADNDYALGLLVEKVAKSPYANDTLIFVIEDDAQDGGDHVDAHRSIGYIVGPYVKRGGVVVSEHYTTVSMVRTIEDVLGIKPMGLNDGLAEPMAAVFDLDHRDWTYQAVYPEILRTTGLPQPEEKTASAADVALTIAYPCHDRPKRDAAFWEKAMNGQNFMVEDRLDTPRFNQALWAGLKEDMPFPGIRHGHDMREDRASLLKAFQEKVQQECTARVGEMIKPPTAG